MSAYKRRYGRTVAEGGFDSLTLEEFMVIANAGSPGTWDPEMLRRWWRNYDDPTELAAIKADPVAHPEALTMYIHGGEAMCAYVGAVGHPGMGWHDWYEGVQNRAKVNAMDEAYKHWKIGEHYTSYADQRLHAALGAGEPSRTLWFILGGAAVVGGLYWLTRKHETSSTSPASMPSMPTLPFDENVAFAESVSRIQAKTGYPVADVQSLVSHLKNLHIITLPYNMIPPINGDGISASLDALKVLGQDTYDKFHDAGVGFNRLEAFKNQQLT